MRIMLWDSPVTRVQMLQLTGTSKKIAAFQKMFTFASRLAIFCPLGTYIINVSLNPCQYLTT